MTDARYADIQGIDVERLQTWVGRTQTHRDRAFGAPLKGLAGLLDHAAPPWREGEVPPLGHWLYFLEHPRQSTLDLDGHPQRGDFLPPVPLPRRMWAASRVTFRAPIPLGADMARRSTVIAVTAKQGRTGPMIFVTVRHEILLGDSDSDSDVALDEEQDIVYRMPANPVTTATARAAGAVSQSELTRTFSPGPLSLFRFSALTCNAHRIHYDRDYARNVEGYPGLVVHGPLVATLLMDHYLRQAPGQSICSFTFRAERPLFDTAPFDVCSQLHASGAELWAVGPDGVTAVSAVVVAGKTGGPRQAGEASAAAIRR